MAGGQLGSRPLRGRVVEAARRGRLVSAQPPGRCLWPWTLAERLGGCRPRDRLVRCPGRPVGAGPAVGGADDRSPRRPNPDRHLCARHRDRAEGLVPVVLRTRCRLGSRGPDDQGRARRRGVDHQRPEGVDLPGNHCRSRDAPGTDRPRCPQTPRHHLDGHRHAPGRCGTSAVVRDDGPRDVQRGVPHRRARAGRRSDRRDQRRMGCGQHHPRQRACGSGCGRRWCGGHCGAGDRGRKSGSSGRRLRDGAAEEEVPERR